MLIFQISKRFGTELVRLRLSVIIMLGLPAFMAFMFFFAFSSSGLGEAQTYTIGVINDDKGINSDLSDYLKAARASGFDIGINDSTLDNGFAADFIEILNTTNYPTEDNEENVKIFHALLIENDSIGRKKVESREIDGLITFGDTYSNATLSAINQAYKVENGSFIDDPPFYTGPAFPKDYNGSIDIIGDENYANYMISKAILTSFISSFLEQIKSFNYQGGNLNYNIQSLSVEEYTPFDTMMPGILVFAVISQAGIIGAFLVNEFNENKTIMRIKLSLIHPLEYILGVTLLMFVVTLFQVIILLGFSMIFLGFKPVGNILQGIIIILLTTFFTAALSFFIASFFKSSDAAGQSSGFLMTPIAFMSGAFMDVPAITIFQASFPTPSGLMRDFGLWDLVPTTHTVNALRSILLYNFELNDVLAEIIWLVVPSIILLLLGIILFTKQRLMGDIV